MRTKLRSLVVLALVAVASAATATLAQKGGAEKPAIKSDFVKVGDAYLRISRIDAVYYQETHRKVYLSFAGDPFVGQDARPRYDPEECVELFRALGLPPIDEEKPGP